MRHPETLLWSLAEPKLARHFKCKSLPNQVRFLRPFVERFTQIGLALCSSTSNRLQSLRTSMTQESAINIPLTILGRATSLGAWPRFHQLQLASNVPGRPKPF